MKKNLYYIAPVFIFSLFFGLKTDAATMNVFSKGIISSFNSTSAHFNLSSETSAQSQTFFGEKSTLLPTTKKIVAKLNLDSRTDISTKDNIKGIHQISLSGIPFFSPDFKASLQIDGKVMYVKVPPSLFNIFSSKQETSIPETWIKISPEDINFMKEKYSFLAGIYESFSTFNNQPTEFVKNHQEDILRFTQAMKPTFARSRVTNGKKINVYSLVLDKKVLRANLIAYAKSQSYDGTISNSEIKDIDTMLSTFKISKASFSTFAATGLIEKIVFTVDSYDQYTKKISSSTNVVISYSDYGVPVVVTPPPDAIPLTQFYNTYIKPQMEINTIKGYLSYFNSTAESFYYSNKNYGTASNNGDCANPTFGSLFNPQETNDSYSSSYIRSALRELTKNSNDSKCFNTSTSYAVSVKLPNNTYVCTDNMTYFKERSTQISGPSCQ